jgi:hypothetical protein
MSKVVRYLLPQVRRADQQHFGPPLTNASFELELPGFSAGRPD